MDKLNLYISQLDKELAKYPQFKHAEQKSGVPKAYLVLGVSGVFLTLIVLNVFAPFLTTLIGFIYPAYASFKAIESKDGGKDDAQWLTYWCVFSFFHVVEFFSDVVLYWIPFYYLIKTVFIVWLFAPMTRGAEVVYNKALRPVLFQHSPQVDAGINKLKQKVDDFGKEAAKSD